MVAFLVNFSIIAITYSVIAQSVERLAVNEDVPGSSPGHGARNSYAPDINNIGGLLFLSVTRARKTEAVYKTILSLSKESACRRVGVASTYERSELVTRDRALAIN